MAKNDQPTFKPFYAVSPGQLPGIYSTTLSKYIPSTAGFIGGPTIGTYAPSEDVVLSHQAKNLAEQNARATAIRNARAMAVLSSKSATASQKANARSILTGPDVGEETPPAVVAPKKKAPKDSGNGSGAVPPITPPPVTTTTETQVAPVDFTEEARRQLAGDLESYRSKYASAIASQAAENKLAQDVLSRYGQAVSGYLADAATRAGRDYETQAATQAILGAIGQGVLANPTAGSVFANRPELGFSPLARVVAAQGMQGGAAGANLDQLLGSQLAVDYLSQARRAQQSALAGAGTQAASSSRLLASLLQGQSKTMKGLREQQQQFEQKVPSLIAKRAADLAAADLNARIKEKYFGLAQQREARLSASDQRAAAERGKLTAKQIADIDKRASDKAFAYSEGIKTRTQSVKNGKTVETVSWTKTPVDYQRAFKLMRNEFKSKTDKEIIDTLNSQPSYNVPGKNGRPYISLPDRQSLIDNTTISPALINDAAFNRDSYMKLLEQVNQINQQAG